MLDSQKGSLNQAAAIGAKTAATAVVGRNHVASTAALWHVLPPLVCTAIVLCVLPARYTPDADDAALAVAATAAAATADGSSVPAGSSSSHRQQQHQQQQRQLQQRLRRPRLHFVWPTAEEVRGSIEGWVAGNSIPSQHKNVGADCLQMLFRRWVGEQGGGAQSAVKVLRSRAEHT